MDGIQIYYIVLLVVSVTHGIVSIARGKNSSEIGQAVATAVISHGISIPIAGRIFLWW